MPEACRLLRACRALAGLIPQMTNILDTGSTETAPGGEDTSANSSGPFLGVTSRSQRNSVMTYYGIERHDEWTSHHSSDEIRCSCLTYFAQLKASSILEIGIETDS